MAVRLYDPGIDLVDNKSVFGRVPGSFGVRRQYLDAQCRHHRRIHRRRQLVNRLSRSIGGSPHLSIMNLKGYRLVRCLGCGPCSWVSAMYLRRSFRLASFFFADIFSSFTAASSCSSSSCLPLQGERLAGRRRGNGQRSPVCLFLQLPARIHDRMGQLRNLLLKLRGFWIFCLVFRNTQDGRVLGKIGIAGSIEEGQRLVVVGVADRDRKDGSGTARNSW